MKKLKVVALILGLAVALGAATFGITSAWLTDQDSTSKTFTMGDISYTMGGSFTTSTPIVPGMALIATPITIENNSTVDSQIRIIITYTEYTGTKEAPVKTTDPVYYIGSASSDVVLTLNSGWVNDGNYWYYGSKTGETMSYTTIASTDLNTATNLITALSYSGANVGNEYAAATDLVVTITLQAKQADNVTWSDMGSIDFTTGLAQ